jgi:hypothetical protein
MTARAIAKMKREKHTSDEIRKQIIYINTQHPIIMYAYRALIDSLVVHNLPT